MRRPLRFGLSCVIAIIALSTLGCVQYPTERQGVVDLRPQISFRFDSSRAHLADARVVVDGIDSGRLGDFVDGQGALRILPGSHSIRVVRGAEVLLDERTYVGDGVSKALIVK